MEFDLQLIIHTFLAHDHFFYGFYYSKQILYYRIEYIDTSVNEVIVILIINFAINYLAHLLNV